MDAPRTGSKICCKQFVTAERARIMSIVSIIFDLLWGARPSQEGRDEKVTGGDQKLKIKN
jgi:hypothetical protein